MKLLFIYPNVGSQLGFHYGIAHLSAVLKKAGHDVALWQLCEDIEPLPSRSEFIQRLRQEAADLIGFSVVTNQWPYNKNLAAWAHEAVDVPIICGGIHAMVAPEQILESGLFDYIIRGEAEEALVEFMGKLERKEDISNVCNLALIENGRIRINPVRTLPELKQLPFKDYGIFDFQKIVDTKAGWVGLMGSRGYPICLHRLFQTSNRENYREDSSCGF